MGLIKDIVSSPGRSVAAVATGGVSEWGAAIYGEGAKRGVLPSFGGDSPSFNEQVGKGGVPDSPIKRPNAGAAGLFANNMISQDMQRRRASQTLFTSGQGVLDSPLIASAILLGS